MITKSPIRVTGRRPCVKPDLSRSNQLSAPTAQRIARRIESAAATGRMPRFQRRDEEGKEGVEESVDQGNDRDDGAARHQRETGDADQDRQRRRREQQDDDHEFRRDRLGFLPIGAPELIPRPDLSHTHANDHRICKRRCGIFRTLRPLWGDNAGVAELEYAPGLGPGSRKGLEVRILSPAWSESPVNRGFRLSSGSEHSTRVFPRAPVSAAHARRR